ncbi:glycine betaine ABC transporter substrate-binding protein [Nocardia sp. CDC160]|uniref:glycine betaine ABC transporter substrate-binding protein n=1 Tax=Nocardia sp. CDC160 TaxID=3112166 RepID=UPI002DB75A30|nr:glycine betaine ABC transporter substrate-binding protein [Nocardia sp. CDC160]MEC3916656.1 glycine betaine ABC transporter substrate-binding protein [Nocardia sp. CDC160]
MSARTDSLARRLSRPLLAIAVTAVLAACGSHETGPVLTVGAGDSAESMMIAEIYAGALARTGLRTQTKERMGQRTDLLAGLDSDTIALFGDVSGDLLTALDSTATATKPDAVNAALSKALPEGVVDSDPADGTDLRPTVVAAATRNAEYPSSLKELAPRCAELTVGITTGPPLDALRAPLDPQRDVVEPLRTVYHCDIVHPVTYTNDTDLRKALSDGEIQLGVLGGPPALLPDGGVGLTSLADPDYAFRAASVLPVLRKGALTDQQIRKLNYVAGELTTTDFADMVHQVRDQGAVPSSVARDWLDAHAL